ncbi:methyltransferase domain-containing protein [Polynucleobacter rarus]|uniref:methyltransferase domain-containing protein n=1 Tax=Polynucleobacter rarus TaxID=556055 RepID=UPI000D3E0F43|nr:methyltransferase domain-containing protein [Polynucleobacter rarus]
MGTYQAVIDTTNKNNSHTLAIDFISAHPKNGPLRILDLGCSEGYLGGHLKSCGHTVVGVEVNKVAASRAKQVLDNVFLGNIVQYLSHDIYSRFDIILLGDVLEHTANPQEILEICQSRLLENGLIIISLPNVSHYAIRAMLLDGRWEYADLGILDRTHLRFFTKESSCDLFVKAGLHVDDVKSVQLPTELAANMCSLTLKPDLVRMVESINNSENDGKVFQNVFRLSVSPAKIKAVVIYSAFQNASLLNLRLIFPLKNWASRYDGAIRFRVFEDLIFDDFYWGDVFIFHRESGQDFIDLASLLQKHGKKVVFEIDDLLLDPPDFLSHHKLDDLSKKRLKTILTCSDTLSTTTPRLAREFEKFNKNIFCTPNCAWSIPEITMNDKVRGQFCLVIASSDSVQVDFLIPVLKKLKLNFGTLINFIVIGPPGNHFESAGIDVIRYDILPYRKFGQLLSSLQNPIGIIPLDDSLFSSCKSPVKFFDYSMARIPVICSNVPPYSDIVSDSVTGLLVENETNAWVEGIERLINNPQFSQKISTNAHRFVVENYSPDISGDAWDKLFSSLDIVKSDDFSLLAYGTYVSHFSDKVKNHEFSCTNVEEDSYAESPEGLSIFIDEPKSKIAQRKNSLFSNFHYAGRNYSSLICELENLIKPLATEFNFDESGYLEANPDVAVAVSEGNMSSGRLHFDNYGKYEFRRIWKNL